MVQPAGPVIIDLAGLSVSAEERELLQHPHVGGVILFTRNYESPRQLTELCSEIRASRQSPLLIAVDQEGGRVQRFKEGLTRLPPMGEVNHPELAHTCGWLMAAELLAMGVDISFAPVLDLNKNENTVIGDRSFGDNPVDVSRLAKALMQGMHEAGMAATGKHFPGHGSVKTDSHLTLPMDARDFREIFQQDMQPFIDLIEAGIDAIMPAHILFPEVDAQPVGFSRYWLKEILQKQLNFHGIIFSDDLNMAGAECAGNYATRAEMALDAGCDIILICNNRAGAIEILDHLPEQYTLSADKFNRLKSTFSQDLASIHASPVWKKNIKLLSTDLNNRTIYESNR